jgi:cation-transporting P-type ATPase 13A2
VNTILRNLYLLLFYFDKEVNSNLGNKKYESARVKGSIENDSLKNDELLENLLFEFRFSQYQYSHSEGRFEPIEFDIYKPYSYLIDNYSEGVKEGAEYEGLRNTFGTCNIEIPDKGIFVLLIGSILNPFYIFQIFSVILWYFSEYEIYATCILITSIASITFELVDMRRNFKNLRDMVDYDCNITVKRVSENNQVFYKELHSDELVPGDIIVVPESTKMPCDAIQLTGSSIMNEAMLTGESIPIIKNPLPKIDKEQYDPDEDKNYTLYSGTEVIQTRKLG